MEWVLEHIDERTPAGRLAIDYARAARELGAVSGAVSNACSRCHLGPVGCCEHRRGYAEGMPIELLRLQEIEARRNGWREENMREDRCRYHLDGRGCALTLFRSTLCYSFFCCALIEESCDADGREQATPFFDACRAFYDHIDDGMSSVVAGMRAAVAKGHALLDSRRRLPVVR